MLPTTIFRGFSRWIKKEVLHLNVKKSSTKSSIPAAIRKKYIEIYLLFLTNSRNYVIKNGEFPEKLRDSEVKLKK